MTTDVYNSLLNIIYIIFASKKRYTIQLLYCDKIIVKISSDTTNEVIYNKSFNENAETYLILSNRLRSLFISYNSLYSKLDNLDHRNKIYHQQTIFAQNLKLTINMTTYSESINAVKYHKEINYPKQEIKRYTKRKTIQPRIFVG